MSARFSIDYVARDSKSSSGWKGLGCKLVDKLPEGRKTASEGMQDFTLTEDIELLRGHQLVTVKASPSRPVTGYTIIYPIGGERTWVHPLDR